MRTNVFRKVSLDRLSSPEQLDQQIRVATPRGWVALGAVALLILSGGVWSVTGQISDKVTGSGILVKSGGVLEVVAAATGRVSDVSVSVGDSVTEGQVVAWVAQPELSDQLTAARERLRNVQRAEQQSSTFASSDTRLQLENLSQQRVNLERSIQAADESLRWQLERVEVQQRLLSEGLITRPTLLAAQQQVEEVRQQRRAAEAERVQLDARELAVRNALADARLGGGREIGEATAEVERLEREVRAGSQIRSPYTGRVLEVMAEQGKFLQRGEPVLSLDLTGQAIRELVGVLYVPSIHGKRLHPGMEVQIAPSTVRQEEYGMMIGRVTFVSPFPATLRGMERVVKNDQLVSELASQGAPYEVHADLQLDPTTASRYRWTSSEGPPMEIESGTVVQALVTVESQRPITKVLPLLRRWTGT